MNFDRIIDRCGTHSAKWDMMEATFGVKPAGGIAMWVADMDFQPPACVQRAVERMAAHGVYGYFGDDRAYLDAICWWMQARHGWTVDPKWIFTTHGLVHGTSMCIDAFTRPGDGVVLTREEFIRHEVDYWSNSTPIGYVFGLGVAMGLAVGLIVVYQILFADVQDHLREYATMKAMGYSNFFLSRLVLSEAVILAVLGYIPGYFASLAVYTQARAATNLPVLMTQDRALMVLGLTVLMCAVSALLAMRKLRSADPAEVF